ncbi:hypothetical protein GWI33_014403 [Rhynchophorus ferrugineus]|uniref:Uncharacterized protein n=1 Tax=Rhynchophorus ferrugineus TaxID=354439 RepID=A0A834I4K3_RHYFE|nr:hypothetical protein GWI33_014403 [Rhynchophorus ferrugineus]
MDIARFFLSIYWIFNILLEEPPSISPLYSNVFKITTYEEPKIPSHPLELPPLVAGYSPSVEEVDAPIDT